MSNYSKTSITTDKAVKELFRDAFSEVAELFNINHNVNIDDYLPSLERWLEAMKNETQRSVKNVIFDLASLIEHSLEYFTPAESIDIFLTENPQKLQKNCFYFGFFRYFIKPLYSLEELDLLIISTIEYLDREKAHLIKFGFPKIYPKRSLWINQFLANLYPRPFFSTHLGFQTGSGFGRKTGVPKLASLVVTRMGFHRTPIDNSGV